MLTNEARDKIERTVIGMTKEILDEIARGDIPGSERVRDRLLKALDITHHLTSTHALSRAEILDICPDPSDHRGGPSRAGWYFTFTGTRASVSFFLSNDYEITRKPRGVPVKYSYHIFQGFDESFWTDWTYLTEIENPPRYGQNARQIMHDSDTRPVRIKEYEIHCYKKSGSLDHIEIAENITEAETIRNEWIADRLEMDPYDPIINPLFPTIFAVIDGTDYPIRLSGY